MRKKFTFFQKGRRIGVRKSLLNKINMLLNTGSFTARQLVEELREGKLSVKEVVQHYLDKMEHATKQFNFMCHVRDRHDVLMEATAADDMLAAGKAKGILFGIPVTLKNVFEVSGFRIDKGSLSLASTRPPSTCDATVVRRLREAGCIVLGVTNVPEYLQSFETDNLVYGRTLNPLDIHRNCGGSSGGEGAAIASRASIIGIGTDAIGSVRQPAHYCGISALKPSLGLIPTTGGVPGEVFGFPVGRIVTYGPMALHVDDVDLVMQAVSGPDGIDPLAVKQGVYGDSHTVDLSTLRIAFFTHNKVVDPCAETIKMVEDVAAALRIFVKFVAFDEPLMLDETFALTYDHFILGGEGGQWIKGLVSGHQVSPQLECMIRLAERCVLDASEIERRELRVKLFKEKMDEFMMTYDIILCPTCPSVAEEINQPHTIDDYKRNYSYCMPFSLSGQPAMTVPVRLADSCGLPLGVQIVGRKWEDHVVVAVGRKVEEIFNFFKTM